MYASTSRLRLLAGLALLCPSLTLLSCGKDSSPAPTTSSTDPVQLRFTVTGTTTGTSTGPMANLRVYKTASATAKDSLFYNSESHTGWSSQIPDGSYTETLTRRFRPGEKFTVMAGFKSTNVRPLQSQSNLHVEVWRGTTKFGETDLGYADRNNAALLEGNSSAQSLVRYTIMTLP